jgi:ketosteroid isomerase-like protein
MTTRRDAMGSGKPDDPAHPNVALLQEAFARLARGDVEGFMAVYSDDVRWYGTDLGGRPVVMNKEMILSNAREMVGDLAESSMERLSYVPVGDDLVVCTVRARRRATWQDRTTEGYYVTVYRITNGRISLGGDVASQVLEDFWRTFRAEKPEHERVEADR